MNTFGNKFRVSVFGESHGLCTGVTVDGVCPGMDLDIHDFDEDIARRASGELGTTSRKEDDAPEIISGVLDGRTTGAPLVFRVAFKPTSSISKSQRTWNFEKEEYVNLSVGGRHDVCFALRTPAIVEAVAAIVLADLR